ncbi:MAG: preprotein translocase subunit SecG [Myxococcales bacterium]|nr:preprotein translocase subunit SecG [Myxococcales bacterium]MCB9708559.1 preprotein translocase subunit SecG [Myxococcales bacterium]
MFTALAIFYVFICMFLILVVLLQAGKGGGMGSAFGGTTQTVFGGAGASDFLTRLTSVCAALFMILSATLSYMSSGHGESALEKAAKTTQAPSNTSKAAHTKPSKKSLGKGPNTTPLPNAPMSVPERDIPARTAPGSSDRGAEPGPPALPSP